MAILVLGDTHIGNHIQFGGETVEGLNRRCKEIINAIRLTVEEAKRDHGVTDVLQIGDFFDNARPNFAVLCAAMELIKSSGLRWHIIAGNHDRAGFNAPCSISPLGELPNVWTYEKVARTEICGIPFVMVPYIGSDSAVALSQAQKRIDEIGSTDTIIPCHYGFVEYPSRSDHAKRSDLVSYKNTTYLFGHEHCSRTELDILNSNGRKARAISVGSFAGVSFHDSADSYRSFIISKKSGRICTAEFHNRHAPIFVTADDARTVLEFRHSNPEAPLYVRGVRGVENAAREVCAAGYTEHLRKTGNLENLRKELNVTVDSDVLVEAVMHVTPNLEEQELVYAEALRSMEKHENR